MRVNIEKKEKKRKKPILFLTLLSHTHVSGMLKSGFCFMYKKNK